ncbi:alpha/beta fold hydrolase [Knoellia sp. p5-6-4]|uniref:alpha/beta fold hydrolase n=1 Tax=unclassified Knoellia TaxID=2618719 RepID=UPI0023DBA1BE|nr:alpha/beta fold hydrolase [Knoellia sp. p5-6-4]MDF2146052.1 alpha/beta fold hydrolase [Knoellia sp. p5-6-4]
MRAERLGRQRDEEVQLPRLLTWARVLSLVVIAGLLAGLAVMLSGEPDPPVVPDGARAGTLTLRSCEYVGESGSVAADCGTLVVPENAEADAGRLLALPVTRVRARSDAPKQPIFFLTGGPGQSNMDFEFADRYTADRDVVLVGYRGVDGSVRLDCPEVDSAFKRSSDLLGEASFEAYGAAYRACADRLAESGIDPRRYGLVEQVDDLEVARVALGYDRIDLLSESAGTRTALVYGWRHPESIHRSVLFGVNPPGAFVQDPTATDEQIEQFAAMCAADESCRARTDDLAASMREISRDVPDRWMFLPVKEGNVRAMALLGLLQPASGPATAPMMIDAWLSAEEGDVSGLWVSSLLGDVLTPELFVRGQYASAAMLDAEAARDYFAVGSGDPSDLAHAASSLAWAGGRLVDAWPASPHEERYSTLRTSRVETLLLGGEIDVATPPQIATRELLPYLPNGREVVLPGFGHTQSFFNDQPDAGTRLILTYLDSGRIDASGYTPLRMDFTPPSTYGLLAKRLVGTMLALSALMVVTLAVLARRRRTRDHLGRTTELLTRTVGAVVLGLGGWSLGALAVLAALPGVRIDNELLVVLSVGVPVGLVIHLASLHRSWPRRTVHARLLLGGAGALVGAWVGFEATEVPIALVTVAVGAVAVANLALILLDIARDQSFRQRAAATPSSAGGHLIRVPIQE